MWYILVMLCAYVLGSSSMSFYLSKLKGVDIRKKGSKNLGASNAVVLMGWKAGILVGIHDIGKAALAVILANFFFPNLTYIGAVAGISCVLGHIFPFYLRFKGGKGFASYLGMTIALNWKFALVLLVIVGLVLLITDYIVPGTMITIFSTPVFFGITAHSFVLAGILCIATAVIFVKHWENLVRIVKGTEIGLRSAHRGDHRT